MTSEHECQVTGCDCGRRSRFSLSTNARYMIASYAMAAVLGPVAYVVTTFILRHG